MRIFRLYFFKIGEIDGRFFLLQPLCILFANVPHII